MNIDADTHFLPPEIFKGVPQYLEDAPRLMSEENGNGRIFFPSNGTYYKLEARVCDLKLRINAMKEGFFDKQCLLVNNGAIPDPILSTKSSIYLCQSWNNAVAKVMEKYDCFIGMAQIPHSDPDAAMAEAQRAVKDLGFRAIEIHGRWAGNGLQGKNIECEEWWPFFELAERLRVPLWFHTVGMMGSKTMNPWLPANDWLREFPPFVNSLMGFLLHAQLVCAGLVFGGVMEKFPALRVVLTECDAGWVPSFMDWLDMISEAQQMHKQGGDLWYWELPTSNTHKLRKKPSQYVRDQFSFALASVNGYSIDTLVPFLVNSINLRHNLMIESDYDHAEGTLDIVRRVRQIKNISDEAKDDICGRNAANVLNLKWEPSLYEESS